jgi:hypothetical protein
MRENWRELEKLFGRIQKLIHGRDATVEWNGHISDPDDPAEERQIDVLITTSNGLRISVECRDRSSPQSVMWIEELAGRKVSLGLDGMIAVSPEGFSKLAQKKAKRFGILLYDLQNLTDEEIATWGRPAAVEATFVQFSSLVIAVGVNGDAAARVAAFAGDPELFFRETAEGYTAVMQALGEDIAAGKPSGERNLDASDYTVCGEKAVFVHCSYAAELATIAATCLGVDRIGHPEIPAEMREISVDRFEHSVPEIAYAKSKVSVIVDVSRLTPPANSILHHIAVKFPKEGFTLANYELVGDRRMITRTNAICLEIRKV